MIISKKVFQDREFELVATYGVDSGQVLVFSEADDPKWRDGEDDGFKDIRRYRNNETGEIFQYQRDFPNYSYPLKRLGGLSMNDAIKRGLMVSIPEPVKAHFSYGGCCSQTLSSLGSVLVYDEAKDVHFAVSRTTYGDGSYGVYQAPDGSFFVSTTSLDFEEEDDDPDLAELSRRRQAADVIREDMGSIDLENPVIKDPCYSSFDLAIHLTVRGKFKVTKVSLLDGHMYYRHKNQPELLGYMFEKLLE